MEEEKYSIINKGTCTVYELLNDTSLVIPEYQRPYKWNVHHVSQLLSDIDKQQNKSCYRLGTAVFHQDGSGRRNIVDGQQRTISLMLIVLALINERLWGQDALKINCPNLCDQLKRLEKVLEDLNPDFNSSISQKNIRDNYLAVRRVAGRSDFSEKRIDFFLNKCELVYFELNDISEAFQFFDSQNARGRDLDPHDLLKAFHLREFSKKDESLKAYVVSGWEDTESEKLAKLFSHYLFRIRNWSRGKSARYFGKSHTHLFKGINIDSLARYPYTEQLRMAHKYVDDNNRSASGSGEAEFPFQLDQRIINGRRFFEMISHYKYKSESLEATLRENVEGVATRILNTLNEYPSRKRAGDRYVRSIFDCLLMTYIDKFGVTDLSRAVEQTFVWAYGLRLKMQVVQLASMDNYVLESNMFLLLKEATTPLDFLTVDFPVITQVEARKVDELAGIFKEMGYCE